MDCSICLENITDCITTSCNHKFCKTCIYNWYHINKSCPLCRSVIILPPFNPNPNPIPNQNQYNIQPLNTSPYDENGNLRNRRQNYLDLYHEGQLQYQQLIPFNV